MSLIFTLEPREIEFVSCVFHMQDMIINPATNDDGLAIINIHAKFF
jgi:hypothetical protein